MLVEVENVQKGFATEEGFLPVLRGVSLTLNAGESLALTGESGSGKSTLLTLIGGLDGVDQGEITVAGTTLSGLSDAGRAQYRRHKVGLIFQQFNLIPSLTVAQNIALHARLADRHDAAFCAELTTELGLSSFETRYPETLSGGQQQRVAIGRTLAAKPQVVLADEPTGNLDEETGAQVLDTFLKLTRELNLGLLMVTHSTKVAASLDRNIHLRAGQIT